MNFKDLTLAKRKEILKFRQNLGVVGNPSDFGLTSWFETIEFFKDALYQTTEFSLPTHEIRKMIMANAVVSGNDSEIWNAFVFQVYSIDGKVTYTAKPDEDNVTANIKFA